MHHIPTHTRAQTRLCVSYRGAYIESTIVSEGFKGGTRGAPIMPRDAVSRTAHVGTDQLQIVYQEGHIYVYIYIQGNRIEYQFNIGQKLYYIAINERIVLELHEYL